MWFKRTLVSALSAVCLCTGLGMTASAETVSTYSFVGSISPLYEIAKNAYSELNIVGTTAECISQADGDNTAKITVVQTLEKYSGWFWIWNDVDGAKWEKTVDGSSISLGEYQKRTCRRYISREIGIHAHKQARQDREDYDLQR